MKNLTKKWLAGFLVLVMAMTSLYLPVTAEELLEIEEYSESEKSVSDQLVSQEYAEDTPAVSEETGTDFVAEISEDVLLDVFDEEDEVNFSYEEEIAEEESAQETEDTLFFSEDAASRGLLLESASSTEEASAEIESISYTQAEVYQVLEGTQCSISQDEDGNEYWNYYLPGFMAEDRLTVTYKDGTSWDYLFDDYEYEFINDADSSDRIDANDLYLGSEQAVVHWGPGIHTYTIIYMGAVAEAQIEIIENPYESIEYHRVSTAAEYTEKTHGYWNTGSDGEKYFSYDIYPVNGDMLDLHMTDGSTQTYKYYNGYWKNTDSGEILEKSNSVYFNADQWNNHWTVGGSYDVKVTYEGKETTFQISITENPIEFITYEPITIPQIMEGNYSGHGVDGHGNEYGFYNTPEFSTGDQLTVTFKDETYKIYTYEKAEWAFINNTDSTDYIDSGEVNRSSYQDITHWTKGYNTYFISYMGVETEAQVEIIENPYESIEYHRVSTAAEYTEKTHGYWNTDSDGEKYFSYDTYPVDGDMLDLHMANGSIQTYKYYNGYWKNTDSGKILEDDIYFDSNQWKNHWTARGIYDVKVTYAGKETTFQISITDNPVASITYEQISIPLLLERTEGHSDYDYDGNEFWYYYLPWYAEGDRLIVTDTDGTIRSYTYDDNEYEFVNDTDNTDRIDADDVDRTSDQYADHWEAGIVTYTIRYMGSETEAQAEIIKNPYERIEYQRVSTAAELIERTRGYWDIDSDGEEYFWYDVNPAVGDMLILYMEEGSTQTYKYYNGEWKNTDSGEILDKNVYFDTDQRSSHWTEGGNYDVKVTCAGREATFRINITENPVASISYVQASIPRILKESQGRSEYDNDGNEFWYYYLPWYVAGDRLIVTNTDGTSGSYTFDDYADAFINDADNTDRIDTVDVDRTSDQYADHWDIGLHTYSLSYMGAEAEMQVEIIENPYAGIEYERVSTEREYVEETHGYWDTDSRGERFYYYEVYEKNGDMLILHMTDGSIRTYTFSDGDWENTDSGEILEGYLNYYSNQWSSHWEAGNSYPVTVTYAGFESVFQVQISESPVASIGYEQASIAQYPKGRYGNLSRDEAGNEYWYYYLPWYRSGDKLTVTYKDSTAKEYTFDPYENQFINNEDSTDTIDTDDLERFSDQHIEHWDIGEHTFTVSYMGAETEMKVEIIENPVKSISYTPASPYQVVEGTECYRSEDDDGNEFWQYYIPWHRNGDKLTVTYTNGTSKDYIFDSYEQMFINDVDGTDMIPADDVEISSDQYIKHWVIGVNTFYKSYMGAETEVPMFVLENPVAGIEFTPVSECIIAENSQGYESTDSEGEEYWYYNTPSFRVGDCLTVNYKNGTSNIYKLSVSETGSAFINTKDPSDMIRTYNIEVTSDQRKKHWGLGEHTVTIRYMNAETERKVTIVEDHVERISYEPAVPYQLAEYGYGEYNDDNAGNEIFIYDMPDYQDGDLVTLHYTDGTEQRYKYSSETYGFISTADPSRELWEEYGYYGFESDQWNENWTLGKGNVMNFVLADKHKVEVPVEIIPNTAVSLTFTPVNQVILSEETSAGWTETNDAGEEYFYYRPYVFQHGDRMTIRYNDGSAKTYSFDRSRWIFINTKDSKDILYGYHVDITSEQNDKWEPGEHFMKIRCMGCMTELSVYVTDGQGLTGITISDGEELVMVTKTSKQLSVSAIPEEADPGRIVWKSSNEGIARVDENGLVTAVNYGTAMITASTEDGTYWDTCSIRTLFCDAADESAYYYAPVYWAAENGITTGYGEGTFVPDGTCTRAMIVTLLYRLAGEPSVTPTKAFSDVNSNDWYCNAVSWAVQEGITTGYGAGTFQPKALCNRAMIVTFLERYAQKFDPKYQPAGSSAPSFPDVAAGTWYYNSVRWAAQNGITTGKGDGKFYPMENCTRGQAVTFLYRYANK